MTVRQRPTAADGALVVVAVALLVLNGLADAYALGEVLALAIVAALPLAWRREAPVATLLLVGAGLVACLLVFEPYTASVAVAMIALYTVAVQGDRHQSLVVGAVTAVVLVATIGVIDARGTVSEGSLRLLLVFGALVVGDTVRSRRALRAAAAERAVQRQREREQAIERRAVQERLQIARELHDTIAHALVAINVRAGVAERLPAGSAEAITEIKQGSAEALSELRSTLSVLREDHGEPPTAPPQDLAALPALCDRARAGGLRTDADVDLAGATITSTVGRAAFRIVQEALTNVMRHADATCARVRIRVVTGIVEIDVSDDGTSATGAPEGYGLRGMAERAAALGGQVDAGPGTGGGWHVRARLPLVTRR